MAAKNVSAVAARVTTPEAQGAQRLLNFETAAAESAPDEVATVNVLEEPGAPLEQRIKTAADDYQLQMQAYALALRELLPAGVPLQSLRATLHFIDPNVEVAVAAVLLDREMCINAIDDAMNTIAALDGTLDADQFPPLPATHCRMCNFQDLCPAGREWFRGAVLSPSPFGRGSG